MVREICHQNCNDCDMRFSHVTAQAIVQCDIISIRISRDDIADIFQSTKILCHDTCNICREFQFNSEAEHKKYCYTPVHGIRNSYYRRPHLPITEPVPRFPPCDELTPNQDLACQRIRHPAIHDTPSIAD